ncbi:MAG: SirB1 family protein [Pseudomonadota bacterium]|uniref:SirB1 family protein n=1 Tax=Thermithiobacillus tepidarius TaxID=929 RepID=UPI0009DB9D30|nr:tetratricopeptide repeat protein [Thermithiobacillus tepidarius]
MWYGKQRLVRELEQLLRDEGGGGHLLAVGLLISVLDSRPPDLAAAEAFVTEQSARVRVLAADMADPRHAVAVLNQVFFQECAFQASPSGAYQPSYSDLSEVLAQRVGIPISLAVFYLEIGRQAGLPLVGINFPGHFLVGLESGGQIQPIDVYQGGQLLSEQECRQRLEKLYGDTLRFERAMLQPATPRAIWVRILNNLKGYFIQSGQENWAAEMIDRILLIDPRRYTEYRDRGLLHYHGGRSQEAAADLQQYLHFVPDAPDAAMIRALLAEIVEERPPLH